MQAKYDHQPLFRASPESDRRSTPPRPEPILERDFRIAAEERQDRKTRIGELLVEKGLCTDQDIALALASQLGLPIVDLKTYPVEPAAVEKLNEKVALKHLLLPLSIEGKTLHIAVVDPLNLDAVEDIRFISNMQINIHQVYIIDIMLIKLKN